MARYKALRKGYPDRQVEPDEEFDFDGVPGSWMEPLCDTAKQRFAARFGADAKPKAGVDDRRPIGAAPVGSKSANPEIAALKAHIASLENLVLKLTPAAPQEPAIPPSGVSGAELSPEVAEALKSRRTRGQKEPGDGEKA